MYHLGARWYDSNLRRFISVDPQPGKSDDLSSYNEYAYCSNNPITRVDPDGNRWRFSNPLTNWLVNKGYGDAIDYLYTHSKTWKFLLDHPYASGAAIGVASGLTAYGISALIQYALNPQFAGRQAQHILNRHAPWSRGWGTKFPSNWSDAKILRAARSVAGRTYNATIGPNLTGPGGIYKIAKYGGIAIKVIITPAGRIWTAFPY